MVDAPSAYPLAWPPNRPRKPPELRRGWQFGTVLRSTLDPNDERKTKKDKPLTRSEARDRLARELDLLGARDPVLSSNIRSSTNPFDPGVAVYFQLDGRPMVHACDTYTDVAQNIAAIAATLMAMRRIEQYGAVTTHQMFTGFLALPAPMVVDDWREALGNPATLSEAESSFRERMKKAHPDLGGTDAQASVLTAAITRAREVLR